MVTSRSQAWAGNNSAMLDLFGKNKTVYLSEQTMSAYKEMQAYCLEAFVYEALPHTKRLKVKQGRDSLQYMPLSKENTASAMVRRCYVREEFPELYENQKNSKWVGWSTTSGEVTDNDFLQRSYLRADQYVTRMVSGNVGFVLYENSKVGFSLPVAFIFDEYRSIIEQDVVNATSGFEKLALEVFDGFVVKFNSPSKKLGLTTFLTGNLVITEENYEFQNRKKKTFPTFFETGCALLEKALPKMSGYTSIHDIRLLTTQKKAQSNPEAPKDTTSKEFRDYIAAQMVKLFSKY